MKGRVSKAAAARASRASLALHCRSPRAPYCQGVTRNVEKDWRYAVKSSPDPGLTMLGSALEADPSVHCSSCLGRSLGQARGCAGGSWPTREHTAHRHPARSKKNTRVRELLTLPVSVSSCAQLLSLMFGIPNLPSFGQCASVDPTEQRTKTSASCSFVMPTPIHHRPESRGLLGQRSQLRRFGGSLVLLLSKQPTMRVGAIWSN